MTPHEMLDQGARLAREQARLVALPVFRFRDPHVEVVAEHDELGLVRFRAREQRFPREPAVIEHGNRARRQRLRAPVRQPNRAARSAVDRFERRDPHGFDALRDERREDGAVRPEIDGLGEREAEESACLDARRGRDAREISESEQAARIVSARARALSERPDAAEAEALPPAAAALTDARKTETAHAVRVAHLVAPQLIGRRRAELR